MQKYKNKIVFYVIKGSTLKKFVLFDMITGMGVYYLLKAAFSSVVVCIIGSVIVPEGIKKHNKRNNIVIVKSKPKKR